MHTLCNSIYKYHKNIHINFEFSSNRLLSGNSFTIGIVVPGNGSYANYIIGCTLVLIPGNGSSANYIFGVHWYSSQVMLVMPIIYLGVHWYSSQVWR